MKNDSGHAGCALDRELDLQLEWLNSKAMVLSLIHHMITSRGHEKCDAIIVVRLAVNGPTHEGGGPENAHKTIHFWVFRQIGLRTQRSRSAVGYSRSDEICDTMRLFVWFLFSFSPMWLLCNVWRVTKIFVTRSCFFSDRAMYVQIIRISVRYNCFTCVRELNSTKTTRS